MNPQHVLATDKARMEGADASTVLESYIKAYGDKQGAAMFKAYAATPMPDGRPRSQVNLGDPHEWE